MDKIESIILVVMAIRMLLIGYFFQGLNLNPWNIEIVLIADSKPFGILESVSKVSL